MIARIWNGAYAGSTVMLTLPDPEDDRFLIERDLTAAHYDVHIPPDSQQV